MLPYDAVKSYCKLVKEELDFYAQCHPDKKDLKRYHRNLFMPDGALDPLGIYGYASRLKAALLALTALNKTKSIVRLLDAGCGYGTESILFGLLGANVTGVEIDPERVKMALSRLDFYRDRFLSPLSIQFINADVISHLKSAEPFDIIWVMEAISHIHPAGDFLSLAHGGLSPEGLLIVSDPNGLNPLSIYRAYRIRGTLRFTLRAKGLEPRKDKPVFESVERIFSVLHYAKKLKRAGFKIKQINMSGFLASSFIPLSLHRKKQVITLLTSLQRILQVFPIIRLWGVNYTVVAQKED